MSGSLILSFNARSPVASPLGHYRHITSGWFPPNIPTVHFLIPLMDKVLLLGLQLATVFFVSCEMTSF